jgi:hypothetical protein
MKNILNMKVIFRNILRAVLGLIIITVLYVIWVPVGVCRALVDFDGAGQLGYDMIDWYNRLRRRYQNGKVDCN